MKYKYEILESIDYADIHYNFDEDLRSDLKEELAEVYRKAEAFDQSMEEIASNIEEMQGYYKKANKHDADTLKWIIEGMSMAKQTMLKHTRQTMLKQSGGGKGSK